MGTHLSMDEMPVAGAAATLWTLLSPFPSLSGLSTCGALQLGSFTLVVYFPASPRWGLSPLPPLRALLLGFSPVPVGPAECDPPQGAGASAGGDGGAELPAGRPPPRPPSILPPSLGGVFGREGGGGSRAGAASRQFA